MSGWRDSEGRTAADRRKRYGAEQRARFAQTLRHRPLALIKPALGAVLVAVLIAALLLGLS